MSAKRRKAGRRRIGRSEAQRQGSAALTQVMLAWEELSDPERLVWNHEGKSRRSCGVDYFKQINLRRLRRGEEMLRSPPQSQMLEAAQLIQRFDIANHREQITLKLHLCREPAVRRSVWATRPCNCGISATAHLYCPRLGWLPEGKDGVREITELYFKKHGGYIREHPAQLVGKRIFVRLRQETDMGTKIYEEVGAVVPEPAG